jgi:solute carrier family 25, member 38
MSDGKSNRASSKFHFLAGLSTGTLSAALLQPADLLKTRVQQTHTSTLGSTLRDIINGPNAIRQLWRGTLPSIIRTGFGSALYFTTLNALRQQVAKGAFLPVSIKDAAVSQASSSSLPKLSNVANLTTGAVARASAGFILMPMTVVKVRYESNLYAYRSLWEATSGILKTEGIRGFFSGFGATAIRDAPYAGLYVLFYEQTKQRLGSLMYNTHLRPMVRMTTGQSASTNFLSGMIAAGCATALTNPFDAVKTRIQLLPGKYGNMIKAVTMMLREEGVKSLFQGLGLRMGRKAMSSALAWTLYEEMVRKAEMKWVRAQSPQHV